MSFWYQCQERAMAPGIGDGWPEFIAVPHTKNARLVRREGDPDSLLSFLRHNGRSLGSAFFITSVGKIIEVGIVGLEDPRTHHWEDYPDGARYHVHVTDGEQEFTVPVGILFPSRDDAHAALDKHKLGELLPEPVDEDAP